MARQRQRETAAILRPCSARPPRYTAPGAAGRLLHTSLVSMLITNNGHVLIGAVTPAVLENAAAQVK